MPRTPEQIIAQQKADAEKEHARIKANLPAAPKSTAVAMPDSRTAVAKYLDDIAPASIVGRLIKFNKEDQFVTSDDGTAIDEEQDFVCLADETLIGWVKFNEKGEAPDRHMGLLYDGFQMPSRDSLGDLDTSKWEIGLDGKPADPWQHHIYIVLQQGETKEMYTLATSSITGRRAIGNLLRHYDRTRKSEMYPIVRLKIGGFQHRDDRVGWVKVPVLAVVGKTPKDGTAKPDSSHAADMNDQLPF